ncbi:MAG: glutathione S-transferase family protein [Rickettsiales bacterium]
MTYQLYYAPGTCSMAVHVLLNEVGQKAELIAEHIHANPRNPEYLKLNPRGAVPVLVVDGKVLREGAAILTYIAETHKSPLLPASGWERAKAQEWLAFANSTLHPAYSRLFFLKGKLGEKAATDPLYTTATQMVQKYWDEVESVLATQDYIAGKEITVADILITVIANWGGYLVQPINLGAKTKAYLKRISGRPAYQAALAAEKVEYKAAA